MPKNVYHDKKVYQYENLQHCRLKYIIKSNSITFFDFLITHNSLPAYV